MKKVSVIMSCYNEEEVYLTQAIESILDQDYVDFEFIIIMDNPDNQSLLDIVKKYVSVDKRIIVIRNERNIGLANSLNKGIEMATGEYVARMDADDISLPSRLKRQVSYLDNNPKCMMTCGNFIKIDENGKEIGKNGTIPKSDKVLTELVKYQYIIAHPTVMMRRQELCDIGKYNNYRAAQDYDLWLRMIKHGYDMHYIIEPLIKYRYRLSSVGGTKKDIQFLSCQFARKLFYENKLFDEACYEGYLREKLQDMQYMKGINYFYQWISFKYPFSFLKSMAIHKDFRIECCNMLKGKRLSKKVRFDRGR